MFAVPLQGERIRFCPMREVDFYTYLGWLNDPEVTKYLDTVRNGISEEGARDYIHLMDASNKDTLFAIIDRVEGKFIGTTHLTIDWTNNSSATGIMIGDKSYWGKGYGTETRELQLWYIFIILFLKKATACPNPEHIGVVKTLQRSGFKRVGKGTDMFGKPVDKYELTMKQYLKMHPSYIDAIPARQGRVLGLWRSEYKGRYKGAMDRVKKPEPREESDGFR